MGVIAGITAMGVAAADMLPVIGGLKTAEPERAATQDESAKPLPPCPWVIGAEPVNFSGCQNRVVTGLEAPDPFPVIPAMPPAEEP